MSNSLYPVRVEIDPKTIEKLNRVYTRAYNEVVSELKSGDKYNTAQRRSIVQSINRALTDLQKETNGILEQDIPKQYNTGKQDAAKQLNNLNVKPQTSFTLVDKDAVASLVDETSRAFAESIRATGRNSEYLLNKVSKEVIREEMAVSKTRGEALKKATARIKGIIEDEGISALTDKGGKQWTLDRYAEMLYRTKSVEARNTGLINSMIQNDFDLVQVSDHVGECQMCAPWEGKILSISGRTAGYPTLAEAESAGLFHPQCFTGDTLVYSTGIIGVSRRRYDGNIVIVTTSENQITVTPNHPILTDAGWVKADTLVKGINVLSNQRDIKLMPRSVNPNDIQRPTQIKQLFDTFSSSPHVSRRSVPVATEDFHGDGIADSNVDIVYIDGFLWNTFQTNLFNFIKQKYLVLTNIIKSFLISVRSFNLFSARDNSTSRGHVSSNGLHFPLSNAHVAHSYFHRFTGSSKFDTMLNKSTSARVSTDTNLTSYLADVLACPVFTDKVVDVQFNSFHGYVYNLETDSGLYSANNIVAHNCRHAINTIHPSLARRTKAYNPDMETQYVPPSEQKRVARVKNPNPRGATNLVQINDELSIRKPSSKNDIKRLNESVRYNAAFQLEGSRSIAGVQGIGDDVIRAIDAVDVSKANNPIEAGNLILKGLPAKYQNSDVVTNTVKQWAQTQQNIFNAKNLAARQSATQSAYTVYRGTGGTYGKGQAVLGRGKYVAMNKANAEQYGDVITKYRLSAQANILDLQDSTALSNFQSEAIAKHADKYAKLLETNTADKAIAEVMRDHATQLGFDAIRGDDKAYGTVVFKESLLQLID